MRDTITSQRQTLMQQGRCLVLRSLRLGLVSRPEFYPQLKALDYSRMGILMGRWLRRAYLRHYRLWYKCMEAVDRVALGLLVAMYRDALEAPSDRLLLDKGFRVRIYALRALLRDAGRLPEDRYGRL